MSEKIIKRKRYFRIRLKFEHAEVNEQTALLVRVAATRMKSARLKLVLRSPS